MRRACGILIITVGMVGFAVVVFLCWVFSPRPQGVPELPFKGIEVKKVVYCYNPPGPKGEGPTYAVYQLLPFNVDKWLADRKLSSPYYRAEPDTSTRWIAGRSMSSRCRKMIQATFANGSLPREKLRLFPWKTWIESNSIFLCPVEMDDRTYSGEKGEVFEIAFWVLDKRNYRMYLVSEGY